MKNFLAIFIGLLLTAQFATPSATQTCPCCGRILSQGAAGISSQSGGDLSSGQNGQNGGAGTHGGGTSNADASGFANSMPTKSGGYCAREGRQLVGKITGDSYFDQGVGSGGAAGSGQYLLDSGHFDAGVDNGVYNNGDTRIYQGGKNGNGHWETYYDGGWYSDFQQKGALTGNLSSGYYSSSQLYKIKQ